MTFRAGLSAFVFLGATALAPAAFADEASLKAEIAQLREQMQQQAAQLERLQKQADEAASKSATAAAPPLETLPDQPASPVQQISEKPQSDTQIGGYGELNYKNYVKDNSRSQADLRRFVLTVAHQFKDKLSFNGEMEFEHAVTSSTDSGEAEIEQAFLAYQLNRSVNVKVGLFLMPFGLLNTSHEPTAYYGVERNEIETRIIPSTWREGGVGVFGSTPFGLDWDVGVTTGFDTAKFEEPDAPLSGVHQELQLAKADDLSVYGALNYRGVPGLTIGGSIFHGNSLHGNADFKSDSSLPDFSGFNAPITLWDVHGRWQAHGLDLQAVYAHGVFGDSAGLDAVIDAYNIANGDDLPFVPKAFYGWLAQGAYTIWDNGEMSLTPFVRYETYDTQDDMPAGFTADPLNADKVTTLGFSFRPDANVVLKGDYQWFDSNRANERFNLGIGYQF